jgi:glucose/arabinose dehydrogenase
VNAQGGGAGTPSLLTRDKFDQKWDKPFFDAIKKGVPSAGMEAYDTLSDEEIWALVVHIRERQKQGIYQAEGITTKESGGVYRSKRANFKVETVVDTTAGLKTPWAIDWLPNGNMIVTNRPGQMHLVRSGQLIEISDMPPTLELGQGGLMEVAVHPDYAKNGWIYLALTDPAKAGGRSGMTKIVRGKLQVSGNSAKWTSPETIWEADQKFYSGAGIHFGSRIVFDGKGNIFFAVGERGGNMLAQELTNPFGKIYRVKEDGKIPADNPFVSNPDAIPGIWSYGHRNQQGLVLDTQGNLWDTEHGPRGGDELNLIKKGANYGWPVVAYSINYNDSPFRTPWPKDGASIEQPAFRWLPSIGACGMDIMKGNAFTDWKGDIFAGGLSGQNVDRFRVSNGKMVEQEEILYGMGRVREVATGPDGLLYVALNQPDKIIRLVPVP